MVYGVFGGCYSDWYIVGYFSNRLDAEKYCAAYGPDEYYVEEMRDLTNDRDLSEITLKYEHEVIFDFFDGSWVMRNEPHRYEYYISDELKPNSIQNHSYGCHWVCIRVNIEKDDRKLAEKIAQDYFYELLAYGDSRNVYNQYVELMNNTFMEPYKIKEQLKKEEEIKQRAG